MTESVVHHREGDRPPVPLTKAERLVRAFERTFGTESKILAEHAALPIALTPDLLNLLRINFLFDKPGLSFLSESDLLLSPLCGEVEDGLYEFVSPDVRNLLLQHLLDDFGLTRIREIATLLLSYSQWEPPCPPEFPYLPVCQMWTAAAFLNPQRARREFNNAQEQVLAKAEPERDLDRVEPLPNRQWFFATREKWDLPILDEIERQTINCLAEDTANTSAMEQMKVEFERQYGTAVDFDKYPLERFNQIATSEILFRRSLFYDILCLHNQWLSSLVLDRRVLRIEDFATSFPDFEARRGFESDIFLNAWREVGFFRDPDRPDAPIEKVGYPFCANTMLLVYDRTLFEDDRSKSAYRKHYGEDLDVPRDWKAFRRVAEFFRPDRPDRTDGPTYGVALQGKDDWLYYEWCNFAFGMGGGVMEKKYGWEGNLDTRLLIDSPETVAATKFYISLKKFNVGDFFPIGGTEQLALIRSNRVALAIIWSDLAFRLIQDRDAQRFGFAPIPGDKSMLAGGVFYVNLRSRHQKMAVEYILKLMQKEEQVRLMTMGLCSALRSVYDDPKVKRVPYAAALRKSLERGVYMLEAGPDAEAIRQVLTAALQQMWRGETHVESGLRDARRQIERHRYRYFS